MPEPNPPRRPLATFLRPADPGSDAPRPSAVQTAAADDVPGDAPISGPATPAAGVTAQQPGFLRGPVAQLRTPGWQWGMVVALCLLLLLQIALADRARLAADPQTRPWVATLCGALGCSLPPWHEPTAFTMTSRDVRPVPGQAGVLQVQASIRNDARWAQDWPSLRLSLSDADGRVIGAGVVGAPDYLGAEATVVSHLEPGQSAQIAFQVREPAASTVAFNFEFL